MLPILYKYTSKGQAQQWEIKVYADSFYTIEGIVGGKLTTSDPTICTGKNIGKANETTAEEQAILEAKSRWQKKLDKGYNEVLTEEKRFFEPMLAFEFSKYEDLLFTVPTYVQPKLDGMRSIKDGKLTSRNGKEIVSCPHLEGDGPKLDGELYNHDLKDDFNKIMSLVKKTKPTPEDLLESKEKVKYWVYDFPDHVGPFSQRYMALQLELSKLEYSESFVVVPTYRVETMDQVIELHASFIEQGFEGSIIRMDLGNYENKRSKQLLKYKDFMDAEFEIYDVKPGLGNRSDCAATLSIVVYETSPTTGVGCSVTMTGTQDFMRKVLRDKEQIIGKKCTAKFFGYTKDGSLRFPTLKHIHDYE